MEQKFRSILLLIALVMANTISAQKFIRYQMNDNTYNGFYTASIDSIKYVYENSGVETITYIDDLCYHIPITKIDSITFEGASTEKNEFDGYRIYEVSRPDEVFKKIYVDNRSVVMMSQTGEFSKNDTILIASTYNQFKYLICTDENGAIVRIFDEEELYFIDYGKNENIDIFTSNENIYSTQLTIPQETGIYAFCQQLKEILTAINKKHMPLKGWSKAAKYSTEFILTLLQKAQKESIVKDKVLIIDETLKEEDEPGVIASTEEIQGSPSKDAFILYIVTVIKEGDETSKKLKEKNPKEKQVEAYRKYYNKKYDIKLSALPPDSKSITQTSAQLTGELYTTETTRRGKAYFLLSSENDKGKEIAATEESIKNNSYTLTAKADGLTANKEYIYTVTYKCKVQGLEFTYTSEKQSFKTLPLEPTATTGEATNVKQESATVECTYQNVPQGAVCGVEFWGRNEQARKQSTPSTTDGSQSISLFGLRVSTNYSYRAYLEYKGNIYYGPIKSFTTKPVDLSGTWTLNINEYGKARTLTLTEEGGVIESTEVSESFNGGIWTVQGNTCTISKTIVLGTAYVTFTLKGEFEGSDPNRITGIKYNENYNEVVGSVTGPSTSFIMTR